MLMLYFKKPWDTMKRPTLRNRPTDKQRGDTIVEVLIAIGLLGLVLSGAYVVVSRNVTSNRMSQERLEAVKIAESQFERLKIVTANDTAAFGWSNFCVTQTDTRADAAQAACRVDANGAPTTGTPQYRINITRVAYISMFGNPQAGTRFRANITWENFSGDRIDNLDYYYEVYR